MIVTINTDASWSPRFKSASYAFWIVSNSGKIAKSGIQKFSASNPDIAELRCIVNAMYSLSKSGWEGITQVIINTDSLNSCHVLRKDSMATRKYRLNDSEYKGLRKKFFKIFDSFSNSAWVEFRHVKAHESTTTKRQWVNDWCDQEAKKQLIKWHKINKSNTK